MKDPCGTGLCGTSGRAGAFEKVVQVIFLPSYNCTAPWLIFLAALQIILGFNNPIIPSAMDWIALVDKSICSTGRGRFQCNTFRCLLCNDAGGCSDPDPQIQTGFSKTVRVSRGIIP